MHALSNICRVAVPASRLIPGIAIGSSRTFSHSSAFQRGKSLPEFLDASTPALSAELANLNSKILLPLHLTSEQEKLVYKEKNRATLEADPVPITIGNVTLPLQHIDQNTSIPNRWQTLKSIVDQSSTAEDWENVLRMMEGFRNAGVHLKGQWMEKITRRMSEAGMQHLILKAVQRANKTDLKLKTPGIVHRVFLSMHDKARDSEWDVEETRKALSMSEQLLELMEDKEHLGKDEVGPGDLRASPLVIAVPTSLAAIIAKKQEDAADRAKLLKYASRLMATIEQDENFTKTTLPQIVSDAKAGKEFFPSNTIQSILVLGNALRLSRQVLGADMPNHDVTNISEHIDYIFKAIETGSLDIYGRSRDRFRKETEMYRKLE